MKYDTPRLDEDVAQHYRSWNFFEVIGRPRYAKDEVDIKTCRLSKVRYSREAQRSLAEIIIVVKAVNKSIACT